MKDKKTLLILVTVAVIAVAAYFMFFRKDKDEDADGNVGWIIKNFTPKQINHVRTFWQYVLWMRKQAADYSSGGYTAAAAKKTTFHSFISWCTDESHLNDDSNRQVISAAQAQAVKNHGITEDEWEEAYQRTFDSLL